MTIWMQTRSGAAFDLIHPDPAMVDFREIAEALGQINRFAGHTSRPVSVALHTLTVAEITQKASPSAVPWALLHDAHEAYTGDITTPVQHAIAVMAARAAEVAHRSHANELGAQGAIEDEFSNSVGLCVANCLDNLKSRIDTAILTASGLLWRSPGYPGSVARDQVHHADLVALVTERRDFLGRPRRPWDADIEAIKPLREPIRWRSGPEAAEELYRAFSHHLPALWPGHRR